MKFNLLTSIAVICLFLSSCSATKENTKKLTTTIPEQNNEVLDTLKALNTPADEPNTLIEYQNLSKQNPKAAACAHQISPKNYRASATQTHTLLHTKLEVEPDWKKHEMKGKATLSLKPYLRTTNIVELDAKGFDIKEVALIVNNNKKTLSYTYDSLKLKITLDKQYTKNEEFKVFIEYNAKPEQLKSSDLGVNITDNKGLYFIDADSTDENKPTQLWTQGETQANSCWFPTIDETNQRASQELYVTVNNKFVTLSNGLLVSSKNNSNGTRTDYWKQELKHAPYLTVLVVGDFAVIKDKWRNIEVNYYLEPEFKAYAKDIFGNTPQMLEFFSKKLGVDYPWAKFSQVIVRDFVAGAMENTTAVTFFEDLNMTRRQLIDNNHEDIIAHELFHHWFGDYVTCESWSNIPLNESFATYGEYLWIENKYGRDAADEHLQKDQLDYFNEAMDKQVPIFRYQYYTPDDLFDRHSYQKGGAVLHMLRKYLGDEAFFGGLNLYLNKHKYQSVELSDLRKALEEYCGEDLNWFFNQWFLTASHPKIEIKYSYDNTFKKQYITVNQLQTHILYQIPIDIDIYYTNQKKERHRVVINDTSQVFSFNVNEQPAFVNFDAENMLLCEKFEDQPIEYYIAQFQYAPLFADRYEAIVQLASEENTEKTKNTFIKALNDKYASIRRIAAERVSLASKEAKLTFLPILKQLTNDPDSKVRASALYRIIELNDNEILPLLQKAAKDSSYLVQGTALEGIFNIDSVASMHTAIQLENEQDNNISSFVAKVYSEQAGPEKQAFFENKLNTGDSFNKYGVVEYYGYYLSRFLNNSKVLDTGSKTIEKLAIEDSNWWLRLSAFQNIVRLRDECTAKKNELEKNGKLNSEITAWQAKIDGFQAVIKRIITAEKEDRLKEYYNGY